MAIVVAPFLSSLVEELALEPLEGYRAESFMSSPSAVRAVVTRLAEIAQTGAIGGLLAIPIMGWALGPGAPGVVLAVGLPLIPAGLIASFLLRKAKPDRALAGALFLGLVVLSIWTVVLVH